MDKSSFEDILWATHDAMFKVDIEQGIYSYMSPSVEELIGYKAEYFIGKSLKVFFELVHPEDQHLFKTKKEVLSSKAEELKKNELFFRIKHKSGTYKWVSSKRAIHKDAHNKRYMVGMVRDYDIAMRENLKNIERAKLNSLLFKESHHRIKNSLAMVAGLIEIHDPSNDNFSLEELLNKLKSNINVIANLHESIYMTDELGKIHLDKLLPELFKTCLTIYHKGKDIEFTHSIEAIRLTFEQAKYLSLIFNEVFTNIFKHSLNGDPRAKVEVQAERINNLIVITVSNNGLPFPDDIQNYTDESIGNFILETLLQQIEGSIEYVNDDDPKAIIKIKPA